MRRVIPLAIHSPAPGAYLRAWRHVKAGGRVCVYDWFEQTAAHFATALDRRITARGGAESPWRRFDPTYQTELERDAQELRDHAAWRRRLHGLNGQRWRTDVVQRRLGHLLDGSHTS